MSRNGDALALRYAREHRAGEDHHNRVVGEGHNYMDSWNLVAMVQSPDVLVQIDSALEECDCHLQQVKNEADAAEWLKNGDWDGVLLEVNSPEQGFSACTRLRQVWRGPLIVLVSHEASGDIVKGYESGIDAHIVIPFDARELVARVTAVLRRDRSKRMLS